LRVVKEWPWCDYTWQGKAIGTFLNFMSIGPLGNLHEKKKVEDVENPPVDDGKVEK
jgi:hypothetical protein